MGQPLVDLPDPLENEGVAKAASADDLLAQLASDEIDRLLAEADADAKPIAAAPPTLAPTEAAGAPVPPISTPPTTELPDWLAAQLPPANAPPPMAAALAPLPPAPTPIAPLPPTEPAQPVLSPAAAALSQELDASEGAPGPSAALAPTTTAPADSPSASQPPTAELRSPTAPAPAATESAEITDLPALKSLDEPAAPRSLPLVLRPLEWISAPLDLCPESARELIGKAAILTLVNAIGVLIYVWMFRHHH